jgi:formylmethanofuran dehydrogenase subunit A
MSEFDTGAGSAPRRMAAAPDGTLWVTLYGNGKLLHVEPSYDPGAVEDIQKWFEPYYSIQFANYPVDGSYLQEHEVVAMQGNPTV